MLEGAQQKGAKAAAVRISDVEHVLPQQVQKEALDQVLGVLRAMAALPQEGIERIPVSAAQLFQGGPRIGGRAVPGAQDNAPMRGGKPSASGRWLPPWTIRIWHNATPAGALGSAIAKLRPPIGPTKKSIMRQ